MQKANLQYWVLDIQHACRVGCGAARLYDAGDPGNDTRHGLPKVSGAQLKMLLYKAPEARLRRVPYALPEIREVFWRVDCRHQCLKASGKVICLARVST